MRSGWRGCGATAIGAGSGARTIGAAGTSARGTASQGAAIWSGVHEPERQHMP